MMDGRRALTLLAALVVMWVPVLIGQGLMGALAERDELAGAANPYWLPGEFWSLYIAAPLVAISACVLCLTPGLLLALAMGVGRCVGSWVLCGGALSIVVVSVAAGGVQGLMGRPLVGGGFVGVVAVCSLLAFGVLWWRMRGGRAVAWAVGRPEGWAAVGSLLIGAWVVAAVLGPKIHWESFNGDGAHAYEAAGLLLHQSAPFWAEGVGGIGGFPSWNTWLFTYPSSWFARLFGPIESSARLPWILYLMLMGAGLSAVIGVMRERVMSWIEHGVMWLQLTCYVVVMAYSATYNPWHADIALPATQDTLLMACFLGVLWAWLTDRRGWIVLFVMMTYVSLPNGAALVAMMLVFGLWVGRWRSWRNATLAGALVVSVGLGAVMPMLLVKMGLPGPGGEYGGGDLIGRLMGLNPWQWQRVLCVVLPCGLAPAAGLLVWGWQTRRGQMVTLICAAYFLLFYVQRETAVHYFVPVMVLPLVVFWTLRPLAGGWARPLWLVGGAAGALMAIWICVPRELGIDRSGHALGRAIEIRAAEGGAGRGSAYAAGDALHVLFPVTWDAAARGSFGGSSVPWRYYANRFDGDAVNYVVQALDAAPPEGMSREAEGAYGSWSVYVRDREVWLGHQAMRPAISIARPFWFALRWKAPGPAAGGADMTEPGTETERRSR